MLENYSGPEGPVVLVIMDGMAIGKHTEGDMVLRASTPHLDWLNANTLTSRLRAHGRAVGMPSDADMGNSEVGHNAIGCGRVFEQGASLVNQAIQNRSLFQGDGWNELIQNVHEHKSALHFIGLLSDGNVHSHIDHVEAMLREAGVAGIAKVRLHILLDGRDVPPTSALDYVDRLETLLAELNQQGVDYRVASGGGRMKITMDRYEAEWEMVERGWALQVRGEGRAFASAREAIETFRSEHPNVIDQDLPGFVVTDGDRPVGPIVDHDSVIFFNFRGDRGIEITRAFEEEGFDAFDCGKRPNVLYAVMMQYDGDLHIPKRYLVSPPAIDRTMGEYLAATGIRQLAVSETQKYGHVTYFFNGNRSGKFNEALEDYIEIPSDTIPFEQRPWMKAAEITDVVVEGIRNNSHRFIRLNYPNGDMVGHTGDCLATEISVEAVDLGVGRLWEAIRRANGMLVVSADHGNADDMFQRDIKTGAPVMDAATGRPLPKTSHSLNPVPVHIYDPSGAAKARLADREDLGVSSLTATCMTLLGFRPPDIYDPSIVEVGG